MSGLGEYTLSELKAELARRNSKQFPVPLRDIDWDTVTDMAANHVNDVANKKRTKDFKSYLFGAVMTSVFGEDFFDWYNRNYDGE